MLAAFVLVLSGTAADAADTIINLDATHVGNYGSPTAWVVTLAPGPYTVQPIGIAEGGLWDAWSAWPANSPCPQPGVCGFQSSYELTIPSLGLVGVNYWDGNFYSSALEALSHAVPSTFTLTATTNVKFSLNDCFSCLGDNRGGLSLKITSTSTPHIDSISPDPGFVGWPVTITGVHFGDQPGSVTLVSGGLYEELSVSDSDWNDDTIEVSLSSTLPTGNYNVQVITASGSSNVAPLKVTTLGQAAANLASQVVSGKYQWGAKGFDYPPSGQGEWIIPEIIFYRAPYYWTTEVKPTDADGNLSPNPGPGLDCSGLVTWAYNKAWGSTALGDANNPLPIATAQDLYDWYVTPIAYSQLQPGDLIFKEYTDPVYKEKLAAKIRLLVAAGKLNKSNAAIDALSITEAKQLLNSYSVGFGGQIHHVMMFIGSLVGTPNDVVQAKGHDDGIIASSSSEVPATTEKPFLYGRPRANVVPLYFQSQSPVSLVVTDPDGYIIGSSTWSISESEGARAVPGELYYDAVGIDAAGYTKDRVSVLKLKDGEYLVRVIPKPGAFPTDTYGLDVVVHGKVTSLAKDVPISDIPSLGYGIIVSEGGDVTPFVPVDSTPPVISATRTPAPNANGWNNSNVTVNFSCADVGGVQSGIGINTVAGLTVTTEGAGQSVTNTGNCVDNAGNAAFPVTVGNINIDKTSPAIIVSASPATLWPPNGKMVLVTIAGTITDSGSGVEASTVTYAVTDEYGSVQPSGKVTLGSNGSYSFTILLQASLDGNDKDGRQYPIIVSAQDKAGNKGSASTAVAVPHDQK